MFDLGSAVVLGFMVVGLISLAKTLIDGPGKSRLIVVVCFFISFLTIVLVAASDFASEQVVLSKPLSTLNFASQLVVTVLLTGLATAIWQGYTTVKNIGENQ